MLLRYMVSFCHKCGAVEKFNIKLTKQSPTLYRLSYKCPRCGYNNDMVSDVENLADLYAKQDVEKS